MYSIIIPAYNEEAWLARSIPAAQAAMAEVAAPGEIVVVDNDSGPELGGNARRLLGIDG